MTATLVAHFPLADPPDSVGVLAPGTTRVVAHDVTGHGFDGKYIDFGDLFSDHAGPGAPAGKPWFRGTVGTVFAGQADGFVTPALGGPDATAGFTAQADFLIATPVQRSVAQPGIETLQAIMSTWTGVGGPYTGWFVTTIPGLLGGYQLAFHMSGFIPDDEHSSSHPMLVFLTALNTEQTYRIRVSYDGVKAKATLWMLVVTNYVELEHIELAGTFSAPLLSILPSIGTHDGETAAAFGYGQNFYGEIHDVKIWTGIPLDTGNPFLQADFRAQSSDAPDASTSDLTAKAHLSGIRLRASGSPSSPGSIADTSGKAHLSGVKFRRR